MKQNQESDNKEPEDEIKKTLSIDITTFLKKQNAHQLSKEEKQYRDEHFSFELKNLKELYHTEEKMKELETFKEIGIENRFEEMKRLFKNNRIWAQAKTDMDPDYFYRLKDIQKPEFLWIGCSDSRVPANEIVGLEPGEVFVHRNIANLIVCNDLSLISVVEFAVNVLNVKHIIVCGHFGCSGVKYAEINANAGLLNPWITCIKDNYRTHRHELDKIKDEKERIDKLVEFNVIEGCMTLMKMATIQKSFAENKFPIVHACIYDISNGKLKDLNIDFIEKMDEMKNIYQYKF